MDKGEVHIWMGGRSWPAWYYDDLPEGVRPAQLRDLVNGRAVLYRVSIGPHAANGGRSSAGHPPGLPSPPGFAPERRFL